MAGEAVQQQCRQPSQEQQAAGTATLLLIQAIVCLFDYACYSYTANTPPSELVASCSSETPDGLVGAPLMQGSKAFPCNAPFLMRAKHVLQNPNLGLSSKWPQLTVQLAMLLSAVLVFLEFLLVYRRAQPSPRGLPVKFSNALRRACALTVRIGGPALCVVHCLLMKLRHAAGGHPTASGPYTLHIYALKGGRNAMMGHLLPAMFTQMVPLRVQLWVGACEAILAIAAACCVAPEPAMTVVSRLLGPAVLLYCLPTFLTWWLQHDQRPHEAATRHVHPDRTQSTCREGKQASMEYVCASSSKKSKDEFMTGSGGRSESSQSQGSSSGSSTQRPGRSSTDAGDIEPAAWPQSAPAAHSAPALAAGATDNVLGEAGACVTAEVAPHPSAEQQATSPLLSPLPSPISPVQEQAPASAPQLSPPVCPTEEQQSPPPRPLPPPQQQQQQQQQPQMLLDVRQLLPMGLPATPASQSERRPSALYTSRASTQVMSLKVHNPRLSYQETAAALQQAVPARLARGLQPGQQLHIRTACVYGCVQMFMWVSQLKDPSSGGANASCTGALNAGHVNAEGAADVHQVLSLIAAEHAAAGPLDVQVGSSAAVRHWVGGTTDEGGASGANVSVATATSLGVDAADDDAEQPSSISSVVLHSIHPPVLPLTPATQPDTSSSTGAPQPPTAATPLVIQLSSPCTRRVRILLLEAASGHLLVDEECEVEGGGAATHHRMSVQRPQAGSARIVRGSTPAITALRLVVCTPKHPAQCDVGDMCHYEPACVYATATLLAASGPIQTELTSLHQEMASEVGITAAGAGEITCAWESLMTDIALIVDLCGPSPGLTSDEGGHTEQAVRRAVGAALLSFAARHGMRALHAFLHQLLEQAGQGGAQKPAMNKGANLANALSTSVTSPPSTTAAARVATKGSTPAATPGSSLSVAFLDTATAMACSLLPAPDVAWLGAALGAAILADLLIDHLSSSCGGKEPTAGPVAGQP